MACAVVRVDQSAAAGARGSPVLARLARSWLRAWVRSAGAIAPWKGTAKSVKPMVARTDLTSGVLAAKEDCSARVRKPRLSRGPATATNTQLSMSNASAMLAAPAVPVTAAHRARRLPGFMPPPPGSAGFVARSYRLRRAQLGCRVGPAGDRERRGKHRDHGHGHGQPGRQHPRDLDQDRGNGRGRGGRA